jgi:hypothetical protein
MGEKKMKIFLLTLLAVSLLLIYAKAAQAHDPYYYDLSVPYHPSPYDPYYELHQMHYQLYLKPYPPYYYQHYPVSPVQLFIIDRRPREIRVVHPVRRR